MVSSKHLLPVAFSLLALYLVGVELSLASQNFVPPKWRAICHSLTDAVVTPAPFLNMFPFNTLNDLLGPKPRTGQKTKATNVSLACVIPNDPKIHWRLNDFRDFVIWNHINEKTTPENRSVIYTVRLACVAGANISLPWPMKVPGLRELYIRFCRLTDRYASYMDPVEASLPDELRVLDIRHSAWVLGSGSGDIALTPENALNLTSAYECGQDTSLEVMIFRNVSDVSDFNINSLNFTMPSGTGDARGTPDGSQGLLNGIVKPEDRLTENSEKVVSASGEFEHSLMPPPNMDLTNIEDSLSKEAQLDFLELLKKSLNTRTSCHYGNLRLMDESMAQFTPLFHFEFLVQGANYPALEVMNYSRIGMNELPRELTEWRRYFPKLTFLDLTYNHISSVSVKKFPTLAPTGRVTFDLRYNKIKTLSLETVTEWSEVDDFFVDIRNNPIDCGCDMKEFILALKDPLDPYPEPYEYIREMTCATPENLAGTMLKAVKEESMKCTDVASSNRLALILLGGTVFVLLLLMLLVIRYKVEIRILLYTRLHVRLPWDADASRHLKKYDAFVSYSNDDATWVYENLVKFLDGSDINPPSSSFPSSPESPYSSTPSFTTSGLSNNSSSSDVGSNHSSVYKDISNGSSVAFQLDHKGDGKKSPSSASSSSTSSFSNNQPIKRQLRLCLHQKDFVPGKTIVDNIVDCIEASRHTIIVLSPRFMKSHWAMEELRQAYRQSLVEKTRHLIVILLETVSCSSNITKVLHPIA